jgi:formate hydrogenlyase subunit 3/multisubunit Na+/H+ antiporter MnhD subunit
MDTLVSLAPLALFAIGVAIVYYRFRDNFSDLAAATDSKQSSGFWTVVALIYAVVIAVLYATFRGGHIPWRFH